MVNNELELIMECNLNGHRDDGRGSCAECGEFIDLPREVLALEEARKTLGIRERATDVALSLRINTLENRVRVLEAALQSLGRAEKGD